MTSTFYNEIDNIYFSQTREYFQEVINSYENGNYRSAIVMLYSLTVCDLLLKLNELSEIYGDSTAKSILDTVKKDREKASHSEWEKQLVITLYKRTDLIDDYTFTELEHLHDYRNFSAHPAFNDTYELITPSQEITIALMRTVMERILIKPPIFIHTVISKLTDDLAEKKDIYIDDIEKLSNFLNSKYLNRMSDSMRISCYRTLWKFTFDNDNDDCEENRVINRMALQVMCDGCINAIKKDIYENGNYYCVLNKNHCLWQLNYYLSQFCELFDYLKQETKDALNAFLERKDLAKAISWYKSNLTDHLKVLEALDLNESNAIPDGIKYINRVYAENGLSDKLIDCWIRVFAKSGKFDTANFRYTYMIKPFLVEMNNNQLIELLEVINGNDQIYNRSANAISCKEIYNVTKEKLADFDYNTVPNFVIPDLESQNDDAIEALLNDDCPF